MKQRENDHMEIREIPRNIQDIFTFRKECEWMSIEWLTMIIDINLGLKNKYVN